jgi:hypothetical protein
MALKITDPHSFLHNLVSRKGKSDLYGVTLTAVSVVADAHIDYEYEVNKTSVEKDLKSLFSREKGDWDSLLVETRMNKLEMVFPISFIHGTEPITVYFISEDHDMSCMVFIPTLNVDEFKYEVVFYTALLNEVAAFAGKTPTTVRFTLGSASIEWDDLVEQGNVQEVTVGY